MVFFSRTRMRAPYHFFKKKRNRSTKERPPNTPTQNYLTAAPACCDPQYDWE